MAKVEDGMIAAILLSTWTVLQFKTPLDQYNNYNLTFSHMNMLLDEQQRADFYSLTLKLIFLNAQ